MSRYLRAGTGIDARCPHCDERLLTLRWCHEERCAEYRARRTRRAVRIAGVLLVLAVLAFAAPALALVQPGGAVRDDVPRALSVRHGMLELDDGGVRYVDGGVWLSDAAALDAARDRARAEALAKAIREAPPEPQGVSPAAVSVVVALVAAACFALGKLAR